MPKHKISSSTGKLGVTFVRAVVEGANCLFHKIDQENDLGIDGIIELIRDEMPLNKQFAVQIKTGETYFDSVKRECAFPVDGHYGYWSGYPLPVYGIVVLPAQKAAYWVDIKHYFKQQPNCTTIRFPATEANAFDDGHFISIFLPTVVKEVPDIPFEKALELCRSEHDDESFIGMVVLFRRFCNRREVWDALVEFFVSHAPEEIPGLLIYFFAHVPWHADIWGVGEQLTEETRVYAKSKFASFTKTHVIKLLGFVDEENMIARGTIGQSVEAIVSSLPDYLSMLADIIRDRSQVSSVREIAAVIFTMRKPQEALPLLKQMADEGSWYMGELFTHIKEWGNFNPYA